MRSYNPSTQARDAVSSDIKRIRREMEAEKAADPKAFAEKNRAANEQAQRYQRMARGGLA